jgi:chemotaxis protein MotB
MIRKRRRASQANHERWLISYADFITLLFAFFVVMFASSQADQAKARRVSEAVQAAFDGPRQTGPKTVAEALAPARDLPLPSLEPALKLLASELEREIRAGKMQVRMEQRGLVISLSQATFFPSGEDTIDPSTFGSLEKVAAAMRALPNLVRAEGHTDSVPIHTARFRSNWDLSAARAIAVMELLRDRWGIPADRLAVTGYADTAPIDSDENDAGRARNRRVDIVILNRVGASAEPSEQVNSQHKK